MYRLSSAILRNVLVFEDIQLLRFRRKNWNTDLSHQSPFLTFSSNKIQIWPFILILYHIDSKSRGVLHSMTKHEAWGLPKFFLFHVAFPVCQFWGWEYNVQLLISGWSNTGWLWPRAPSLSECMEENKFSVSGKTQKGWMTFCWLFAESITTLEMTFQGIFQPPKGQTWNWKSWVWILTLVLKHLSQ